MRLTALSQNTMEDQRSKRTKCDWCQIPGHIEAKCMKKQRGSPKVVVAGLTATESNSKCPNCDKEHHRRDQNAISDWFSSCHFFRQKTPEERIEMANKYLACFSCTSWLHRMEDCPFKSKPCHYKEGSDVCKEEHSRWFHIPSKIVNASKIVSEIIEVQDPAKVIAAVSRNNPSGDTLLQIQDIKIDGTNDLARTLWDCASNAVLISHQYAKKANLKSEEVDFELQSVNSKQKKRGRFYKCTAVENDGTRTPMLAYGIDEIIGEVGGENMEAVRHLFPHVPDTYRFSHWNKLHQNSPIWWTRKE